MIGGVVITNRSDLAERLAFLQNSIGAIQGPFDSFLALRGLKTLPLRMERHNYNAKKIAEFLESNNKIEKVFGTCARATACIEKNRGNTTILEQKTK